MRTAEDLEELRTAIVALRLDGMDADRLEIEPLLNWGGFTNRSYRVSGDDVSYHVKLRPVAEGLDGLRRWRELHDTLERDYHAPPLLDWIDLADAGLQGPVFAWIPGSAPDTVGGRLLDGVADVVRRLHHDRALAEQLNDGARSCADVYFATYHERFDANLAVIAADPPPFLAGADIDALRYEVEQLAARVRASAAFDAPAGAPTHGDLWANNLLVDGQRWFLLDWDELGRGDAVQDWCTLLGPTRSDVRAIIERDWPRVVRPRGAEAERIAIYARATLLDWVVDPLADWIDAIHHPSLTAPFRTGNAQVHRLALAAFERCFGRPGQRG